MKRHVVVPIAYGGFQIKKEGGDLPDHVLGEMKDYLINGDLGVNIDGTASLMQLLDQGWKIILTQSCSCGEGEDLRAVFQYILESPELPYNQA